METIPEIEFILQIPKIHDTTISIPPELAMFVKKMKWLAYRTPGKEGKLKCILQSEGFFWYS